MHVVALLVIVVVACLAFYANNQLSPGGPLRNVLNVVIVVVAVLAVLISLGVMGNPGITIAV